MALEMPSHQGAVAEALGQFQEWKWECMAQHAFIADMMNLYFI